VPSVPVPLAPTPAPSLSLPAAPRSGRRWACWALALLGGGALALLPQGASAETLLERAQRSGELVMVGTTDSPPLASLDAKGQPVGYAIEVGKRVDQEMSAQLAGKVRIRFVPVASTAEMVQAVASGGAALACGVPFSWEREMVVDYSFPIGLSGLRVLSRSGVIDGSPESLKGRRVATVQGSLGATAIKTLQPAAKEVSFPSIERAISALQQGKVDGVLGDSSVLKGLRKTLNLSTTTLVPEVPYVSYGVGCIVPQNNSDLLNVVNLAIAKLQAGYLEGRPDALASVDPWVGPNGVLGISSERIRATFEALQMSREMLVPLTAPPAAAAPGAKPAP
jgi:polar amino acid transport system substrate-binding protein